MAKKKTAAPSQSAKNSTRFDARPDSLDFRDLMYVPTLVEVPQRITLEDYSTEFPDRRPPILDQGQEGACTGFGLAAVANFLLHSRKVDPDRTLISPRMLYDMARRYDEWPGEKYSGSSARGAMKGWHKHGVCSAAQWPYQGRGSSGGLTHARAAEAARRPLGAYFRVNHQELVAMHAALAEVGILFATATVHQGWDEVGADGIIHGPAGKKVLGGHAFAIVGYDDIGFWIQNSWGPTWGRKGFARISYADWLENGNDVWVARLGAPVQVATAGPAGAAGITLLSRSEYSLNDVRPHVVAIGNNGDLRDGGEIGTTPADLDTIFKEAFPEITKGWKKKRILLYAHGGLVGESGAIERVSEYRKALLDAGVYPLAFIWKTDLWTTLGNMLKDGLRKRRPEGILDKAKDFMLDRIDDTLEQITRLPGKAIWGEMKENALLATSSPTGGARLVLKKLADLLKSDPSIELHVGGHSAGSIFMAPVVQALTGTGSVAVGKTARIQGLGLPVRTCTLWAPACTMALFKSAYLPAIKSGAIHRFALFTLKDGAEQDDHCANLYHKSLLYLVSNSFEDTWRFPPLGKGEPILGMERFILDDPIFGVDEAAIRKDNPPTAKLFGRASATWVRGPNGQPDGSPDACEARHHGDFDDEDRTVRATLARILATTSMPGTFQFKTSAASHAERRRRLGAALG